MVSPPAVHPLCSTWLEANHAGSPPHLPAANGLGCSEDYPAGGLCSWKVKVRRGGEGRGCWGGVFSISHTYARAHTHTHTQTQVGVRWTAIQSTAQGQLRAQFHYLTSQLPTPRAVHHQGLSIRAEQPYLPRLELASSSPRSCLWGGSSAHVEGRPNPDCL